jgi:hypothetical protein
LVHKYDKQEIENIQIADIDELYLHSESLHCVGGSFGLICFLIDAILKKLNLEEENVIESLITQYIEYLILNTFNETQFIDIKYLESTKYDLKNITDNRRNEYIEYMLDDRRFINKGLELSVQLGLIDVYNIKRVKKILTDIYFRTPIDPATIEADPTNEEPEYLESIQKQRIEIQLNNEKNEKLKKKIRLTAINKDILKNKRNNICGFISIYPDHKIKKDFTFTDMSEIIPEPFSEQQENPENAEEHKEQQDEPHKVESIYH